MGQALVPPPHAVLCWIDDLAVYVELPCTDGTFHRLTFPLSENGLSRALNLLRSRPKPESHLPPRAIPSSRFTTSQLDAALSALRRVGVA